MKIYLIRHGDSVLTRPDDTRSLSSQGIADLQKIGRFLLSQHICVTNIFHSEKLRAQQTAEILAPCFYTKNPPIIRSDLDPQADITSIMHEVYARLTDSVLVGHLPFLGKLASHLMYGEEDYDPVIFTVGSIACLEKISATRWAMRWMLTPEILPGLACGAS